MKTRILSYLLVAAMLFGMVPFGALTIPASAEAAAQAQTVEKNTTVDPNYTGTATLKASALGGGGSVIGNPTIASTTLVNGAARYYMENDGDESAWSMYRDYQAVPYINASNFGVASSVGVNKIHVMEFDLKVDVMPAFTTTDWEGTDNNYKFGAGFIVSPQSGTVGYAVTIVNIADQGLCLGVLDNATKGARSLVPLGKQVSDSVHMRFEFDRVKGTLRAWETNTYLGEFDVVNAPFVNGTYNDTIFGVFTFNRNWTSFDVTLSNLKGGAHAYPAVEQNTTVDPNYTGTATLVGSTLSSGASVDGTTPTIASNVVENNAAHYTMTHDGDEKAWTMYRDLQTVPFLAASNYDRETSVGVTKIHVMDFDLLVTEMPAFTTANWEGGDNNYKFGAGFIINNSSVTVGYAVTITNIGGVLHLGVLDSTTKGERSLVSLGKGLGSTLKMRFEFDREKLVLRAWESDFFVGEFNVVKAPIGNMNTTLVGMFTMVNGWTKFDVTMSNVKGGAHAEAKEKHNVTLTSGTGYTLTGAAEAYEGMPYNFSIALGRGYKKGANFAVKVNGNVVNSDNDTYTVATVPGDMTITVEGVEALYAKNENLAPDHRKPVTLTAPSLNKNNGTAPATATMVGEALRYTMSYQAGETKWSGYSHNIAGDGTNVITVNNYNSNYGTAVGYPKINVLEYTLKIDAMPAWNTTNWDVGLNSDWFTSGFFHNLQVGQHGYAVGITNIEGLGLCLGVLDNATDNMRSLIPLGKQVGATVQMRYEFDVNEQILRVWESDTFLGEFNVLTTPGWSSGDPNRSGVMFGMRSFTVLTEGQSIDVTMSNLVSSAHAYPATEHTVTLTAGEGYTLTGDATVAAGGDYTFTLTVADGYQKGANFAVKVNGNVVNSDSDTYTVPAVTENITVTVEGIEAIPHVNITLTAGEGYTLTGEASVVKGQPYTFTFALANGFKKGANFAVKVNGTPVALTDNTYTVASVTEDITVTVEGVVKISQVKNQTYAADHRKAVTLTADALTADNTATNGACVLTDGALRYTMSYQEGASGWSGYRHTQTVPMLTGQYNSYPTSVGINKVHVMEFDLKVDAMPENNETDWDIGTTNFLFASGFWFVLQKTGAQGYAATIVNIAGKGLCLGVLDNATDNQRSLVATGKSVGSTLKMRYEYDVNKQTLRVWETDTYLGEFNVLNVTYSSNTGTNGAMFGMRHFADALKETESIDVTMSNLVSAAHAYTAAIGETQYSTLSEAAEAAAGKQTVKLLATTNESVVLDGDLYLDINGINYTAASISGNGTIYGMDSTIDVSSATNVQHTFLPNNLSENVTISRYHEIDGKTYWVRKNGGYYIFHNLVLNTSENVALRPDNAVDGAINPGLSFYYSLQADGRLAAYINASTHGIAISFEDPSGFTKLSDYKAYSSHRTDAVAGGTLFEGAGSLFSGIMSEALPDATNIANAEMTIYARAYIRSTHNDHIPAPGGEFLVFGDVIEISLADLIKDADDKWDTLEAEQQAALQVLYKAFPEEAVALGVNEAHFNENAGEGQAPAEGEQVIEFPVATTEIETYNIALKDNIGFTFFVGAMDYEVEYAKVRVQIGTYEPVVFNLSDLTPNAEGKYEIRANVHAAQMTMVIKVEVLLGEEVVHSGAVTVQTYAKAFMELYAGNPEYEKVINVLEDMLHYGTAAQNYFILNTRNPANKDLEDVRDNAIPELVKPTVNNAAGIEYVGATMLFQNRTYVRFYFKVTEGTIADYTFTINGNKVEPVQKGNQYYIESGYIYAHELDIALAVEVNDNAVVTYSPLNYIVNTYNKGENAEGTRLELMQDMYDYYVAAKALNDSLPA